MSNQNADQAGEIARYAAIDQNTPVIAWYGAPSHYGHVPPPDIIPPALQCGPLRPRPLADYRETIENAYPGAYWSAPAALYLDGRRVLSIVLDDSGRTYRVETYQDIRALVYSMSNPGADQAIPAAPGSGAQLLASGRARIRAYLYGTRAMDGGRS